MKTLTDRQREILDMLSLYIKDTGFPPTRVEICEALGFKSPNAAEEHLKALEKKGAISMVPGASRSIKLLNNLNSSDNFNITLPLIGRVSAGYPVFSEEHIESHYRFDSSLFKIRPDYLLRVKGMSMKNAGIIEDDFLVVKKNTGSNFQKKNGQIVVARIDDEVTVKRMEQKNSYIYLHPENPDFKTIVINLERESFTVEGYGIGIIRNPSNGL